MMFEAVIEANSSQWILWLDFLGESELKIGKAGSWNCTTGVLFLKC